MHNVTLITTSHTFAAIPLMIYRSGLSTDGTFLRTYAFGYVQLKIVLTVSYLAAANTFTAVPFMTENACHDNALLNTDSLDSFQERGMRSQ